MSAKTTAVGEAGEVTRWRFERLLESGFERRLAALTARNAGYDLHALIELVEDGCPPHLAVRILAPDDHEAAA